MLGRAAPRLWRAAQWAPHSDAASVVSSAFDSATSYCIHNPAQQLISLRAFSAFSSPHPALIRDFAIIAHVDHGKTTLMDRLLAHCGHASAQERFMDSNALEKERGITINSKYTSLQHGKYTLNAVDTPGHADFGGEVERILGMVDGAVLLVDANEGPLQQTKFVVEKALRAGICPIVVLNKVDRLGATEERCGEVESSIFDLFAHLGATEEQLDFPVLYASARQGWADSVLPEAGSKPEHASVEPLLDTIVRHIPPPADSTADPFAMLVAMVEHDSFLGRVATGRVAAGQAKVGDRVRVLHHAGELVEEGRLTKLWKRSGLGRIDLAAIGAGDIVSVTGLNAASIANTIGSPEITTPLPPGNIEPPTLSMVFSPNDSPLAGREGSHLTGSKIGERLANEAATSVSLRVLPVKGGGEAFEVQARGELQLGLLIENMRREGFELSVSPPRVVFKEEGGRRLEPLEEVICEVDDDQMGSVIEALSNRRAELKEMIPLNMAGKQRLVFEAPSRGLIGFRSSFATLTRGTGILHRAFSRYGPYKGPLDGVRKGVLVSTADGKTTLHALGSLEARGSLFTAPATEVYQGMVVGECARDNDMEVNPVREKKLTNIRTVNADEKTYLTPPRVLTLEDVIGYVAGDELIEVTPKSIRLRKQILEGNLRKSGKKRAVG